MRDEINDPIKKSPEPAPTRVALRPTAVAVGFIAAACVLAVAGAWVHRVGDSYSQGQLTIARVESDNVGRQVPKAQNAREAEVIPLSSTAFATGEQVEKASGVRVTRNGGGGPSGALIIDVPQALGIRLAPAPDARLVERSKYGDVPRIGTDGSRPADVYARPIVEAVKLRGAPRVAIVVGGLGLDRSATQAAIRLPSAISLGFAPYGEDLRDLVASARDAGHEIMLQAPMEGFGETATGQRTLASVSSEENNRDTLKWMMSRFSGAIGVQNYLGGKLTSDSKAFAPILAEIASRGLLYLDDGSSPRSLTISLASGLNLRAAQADVVIDATSTPEAIETALGKLETVARRQGEAIGVATALPVTLEHVAHWVAALEARGIALTPVSALVGRNSIRSANGAP